MCAGSRGGGSKHAVINELNLVILGHSQANALQMKVSQKRYDLMVSALDSRALSKKEGRLVPFISLGTKQNNHHYLPPPPSLGPNVTLTNSSQSKE